VLAGGYTPNRLSRIWLGATEPAARYISLVVRLPPSWAAVSTYGVLVAVSTPLIGGW
jgi:hypothetical protein